MGTLRRAPLPPGRGKPPCPPQPPPLPSLSHQALCHRHGTHMDLAGGRPGRHTVSGSTLFPVKPHSCHTWSCGQPIPCFPGTPPLHPTPFSSCPPTSGPPLLIFNSGMSHLVFFSHVNASVLHLFQKLFEERNIQYTSLGSFSCQTGLGTQQVLKKGQQGMRRRD